MYVVAPTGPMEMPMPFFGGSLCSRLSDLFLLSLFLNRDRENSILTDIIFIKFKRIYWKLYLWGKRIEKHPLLPIISTLANLLTVFAGAMLLYDRFFSKK